MHRGTIINSKIMIFFPSVPSDHGNCERESNHMPKQLYLYLSGSVFVVSFTARNKQLPSVKSVFKSFGHVSNSYKIYKFAMFL